MKIFDLIKECRNCNICDNQSPLLHLKREADVFWVGLSAVSADNEDEIPLSENTNTGRVVNNIEVALDNISFYRTNVVKCLPLKGSKIRYPSLQEMKSCYTHLANEIKLLSPKIIFLLGRQVASFVLENKGIRRWQLDENYGYRAILIDGIYYVPIHHPSYMLIYKRKYLKNYTDRIEHLIRKNYEDSLAQYVPMN